MLITVDHIHSCFCIKGEGGIGTCFAVGLDDADWLVTAKHNLGTARAGDSVYLKTGAGWAQEQISSVIFSEFDDVAVFSLSEFDVKAPPATHGSGESPLFGQELKFLGFPHGLANTYESPDGFNTPLCRNAFFSGVIVRDGRNLLVLDGFNNPGYSGAPVWYSGKDPQRLYLLGVVSGYRIEERSKSRVYRSLGGGLEEPVDDLFVKPNSGMIHAIPYRYLIELIGRS